MATRRSGRLGKNTKRYTDDAFEEHQVLQEILSSSERAISPQDDSDHLPQHDSEHVPQDDASQESPSSQDESDSNHSRPERKDQGGGTSIQMDAETGEDASDTESVDSNHAADPGSQTPNRSRSKANSAAAKQKNSDSEADSDLEKHSRAIKAQSSRPGRDAGSMLMLGDDPIEAQAVVKAKQWFFDNITLPRRVIALDYNGIPPPIWAVNNGSEGDRWYVNVARLQQLASLDENVPSVYTAGRTQRAVLSGQPATPSIKLLPPHSAIQMDDFVPETSQSLGRKNVRPAWLLNIGLPVQCLAWSPDVTSGYHHFAVASLPTERPEPFTPAIDVPCTIEIWQFKATNQSRPNMAATIDMNTFPIRRLVLCADFGGVLRMAWCPQERSLTSADGIVELGVLAIVSADGHLRLLGVSYVNGADEPLFMKIEATAVDIAPPDTLITCVVWLSENSFAAASADGHVGVWNVDECLQKKETRPMIWHQVSLTYILSIETCLPSRPGIVVTSSMDGFVRWTQLSDPAMDWVQSARSRVGSCFALWHDASQHLLYPEDLYSLRAINLRKAWSTMYLCTLPAPAQAAAVSSRHSSTLVGCSDGTVQVLNPMRRAFAKAFRNADYTQTWFTHDWRTAQEVDGELDYPDGLSRLVSGYVVETSEEPVAAGLFQRNRHGPKSQRESRVTSAGVSFATVHGYGSEIRALSWNPHPSAQGWAAAGMEDGLLLVEDLCWD